MRVIYDVWADALRIIPSDRPIAESEEKRPGFVLAYDADGGVVSVAILDASQSIYVPTRMAYEVPGSC